MKQWNKNIQSNGDIRKQPEFERIQAVFRRSDLAGARTQDPLIKSQMLYQLSYEIIPIKMPFSKGVAKIKAFFGLCKSPNSIFSFCS
jgi:hypothetical protein